MKFGKRIQAEQVPGWSRYYLDYKALKKIISSIGSRRSTPLTPSITAHIRQPVNAPLPVTSRDIFSSDSPGPNEPPLTASLGQDDERGAEFQAIKAAFFFKLERELEKINSFYLEKEAELKLRLETLLSKRRAAAMHTLPDSADDNDAPNHVEWNAVQEGFRLLERDLGKIQQFVEINATGFRKILKKWDKRSKSSTKELYLTRQVDVQPVFNRQLIAELSDTVTACLLDFTDLTVGLKYEGNLAKDEILSHEVYINRSSQMGPFRDLESNLRKAIADRDATALQDIVRYSGSLSQAPEAKMHVTRILWKAAIDAPPDLADLILASAGPFNYAFVDDINGRTCLHEAAIMGEFRLLNLCLQNDVQQDKVDIYGRSALHYAAMHGHTNICRRLIEVGLPPDVRDLDNCTPLIYATLKGSVECVQILLEDGKVSVRTSVLNGEMKPLLLAARAGHLSVVVQLLEYGAPSLPNTNGEYPIHLAAQEGHTEVCRLLSQYEGRDVPDKYNEWTPLFHAARYGHADCLRALVDVGCQVDRLDEVGNSAAYYAAWYGHQSCVATLLEAAARVTAANAPKTHVSPLSDAQFSVGTESDMDAIPLLYLPPPMMPYRVYGHNYLDQNVLVQVSVGHLTSRFGDALAEPSSSVRLRPPLKGSEVTERYLHTSPRLKLVMTPSAPTVTTAPYSIPLPLTDERTVFSFQIPSVESLALEFSLYPNFGTKTIGRATALSSFFSDIQNNEPLILPILDHRLHVIGEVSFEVNVITPFSGVRLQIGGAVETYWKSIANPATNQPQRNAPRLLPSGRPISSAQNSPSAFPMTPIGSHSLTHSSVTGNYLHVTVQVTRDLHPVVFSEWNLPEPGYDLGVADVTLDQFQSLAQRLGRVLVPLDENTPLHEMRKGVDYSMSSLSHILKVIPQSLGICLEVAFPPARTREKYCLRHQVPLNDVVASVLRAVYKATTSEGQASRRNVVFTSFAPDVCSALNWKQPNYPVFLASQCGQSTSNPPSATIISVSDAHDYRLSSLGAAVEWCKMNNMLGLLLNAELLYKIPPLIQGVRDFGLLVGIFGEPQHLTTLSAHDSYAVDACLQHGIMTFIDHSKR